MFGRISTSLALLAAVATIGAQGKAVAPAKLQITDVKVGKGPKAAAGDLLSVTYTGRLTNGRVFDSNDKKDAVPLMVPLGAGTVIRGWEQGLVGMQVGGVRKLVIPPELAYGPREQGSIPPNSTLMFEIKLLDVVKRGEESFYDKNEVKIGKGKVAKAGSKVTVNYIGTLVNGKVFDSTYERSKPLIFTIGAGSVLKAFDMGVVGMKEGGKRALRLPPAIAFGAAGSGTAVPPNSVVKFVIELVKVQ